VARFAGDTSECRRQITGVRGCEKRQDVVADPVAQEPGIAVRRILDPTEADGVEIGLQHAATQIEQRTDDATARGRDTGQSPQSSALEHAHEHGLGLIIGRVAHGDAIGADPVRVGLERNVACLTGGVLQRPA